MTDTPTLLQGLDEDFIVVPKFKTPDERLRAVIEILKFHPERHEQGIWTSDFTDVRDTAEAATCGTTGCVAGWAVAVTPLDQLAPGRRPFGWVAQGAEALGIDGRTAYALFEPNNEHDRLIEALEALAALPPDERMDPELYRTLDVLDRDWLAGVDEPEDDE